MDTSAWTGTDRTPCAPVNRTRLKRVAVLPFAFVRIADIVKSSNRGFAVTEEHRESEPSISSTETLAERLACDVPEIHKPTVRTLVPTVYEELRAIATRLLAHRSSDACLQPTMIVHEAYLKLASSTEASWNDKSHFLALCARVMRQVLMDHAREAQREKRGGAERRRITLTTNLVRGGGSPIDAMAIEDALQRLEVVEPRAARVAEMRFLAGMSVEEVGEVLSVSPRTVELDWRAARAWLRRELGDG
jgi:RNA polymerase sigma-70 factor, ECF subfamily